VSTGVAGPVVIAALSTRASLVVASRNRRVTQGGSQCAD
jgi:hypothetical protein